MVLYLEQDEDPNVHPSKTHVVMPMLADVAAVQLLYGAFTGEAAASDTTYGRGSTAGNFLKGVFGRSEGDLDRDALTVFDDVGTDCLGLCDACGA